MKHFLLVAALVATVAAAPPKPASGIFATIAAQMKGPLTDLTALDAKDKDLRTSEDAQVFSSEAEKKARANLKTKAADVMMDANRADEMRQQIVNMGCPEGGGEAPTELVQRCNPLIDQHRAFAAGVMTRASAVQEEGQQLDALRASISATVLANVQKRKDIAADRDRLTAETDRLQGLAIAEVIKHSKLAAAKACTTGCCHSVIYDGASPQICGVTLVCQSLERAGLFQTKEPICVASRRD